MVHEVDTGLSAAQRLDGGHVLGRTHRRRRTKPPRAAAVATPAILHGHNRGHWQDLIQLLFILAVSVNAAVPITYRLADDNYARLRHLHPTFFFASALNVGSLPHRNRLPGSWMRWNWACDQGADDPPRSWHPPASCSRRRAKTPPRLVNTRCAQCLSQAQRGPRGSRSGDIGSRQVAGPTSAQALLPARGPPPSPPCWPPSNDASVLGPARSRYPTPPRQW